jgi:hypothetical protein
MDITKYINDNLDEIIDDPDLFIENALNNNSYNDNEDDYNDDNIDELYENLKNHKEKDDDQVNDNNVDVDIDFYYNLINIFMIYYNDKYEKKEHFFSGISDVNKDTSSAMELFFDAILEFKQLKEKLVKDFDDDVKEDENLINSIILKFYFDYEDKVKIENLFDIWEGQIYYMEIDKKKIIFPSMIICLNYIYRNNLINSKWSIFNLRNY